MKKSDLIPGKHAIVMRKGWVGLVLDGYLMGESQYYSLKDYTEDLLDIVNDKENDAIKILEIPPYTIFKEIFRSKVVWERHEVKEVTMAEVEKKFGCKVKIIEED